MSRKRFSLQFFFILLTGFFLGHDLSAQSITPVFFGQNAWMPDTIGQASNCTQPPCILYGSLHNKWGKIAESGAGSIRYGGIQVDRNMPTHYQYIKVIDSIRAKGMEPIIEVPYHNGRYSASQAAALVQYINVTKGRNIKYWIIGNEPDLEYSFTTASQVAAYIRPFASAMKAVDPGIKIVGPETSWYNTNIINGLTTPGGPDDITGTDANGRYYVDILSFHTYGYNGTQTRADMITKLTASNGYQDHLVALNTRLVNCNSYHGRSGTNSLRSAVTEANVNYQNSTSDNLNGTGVQSFIGGQFVAEMYGLGLKNNLAFINMWSVVEGNNTALNIGYIDSQTGQKKPAYYHFQMMAQNFAGNYISSTSNQTNVKVFSCQNNGTTTVMMMNEDLTNNFSYTIRLNNATVSGTAPLKISVNGNIAQEYSDVLTNQSTILLFFNQQGQLIKRISYGLAAQAASNLPPVTTLFNPTVAVTGINAPVNVTQPSELTKCTGQQAVLSVNSGTNNSRWYDAASAGNLLGNGSSYTLQTSGSGAQTVYAEAYNTGTVSARTPVTVSVQSAPVVTANSGSICAGGSFSILASGASTYSYSSGSNVVSPAASTSYSVWGISSAGCLSAAPAISSVTVNSLPQITVANGTICPGASFVLTPSGAATYTFSSGSSTVSPNSNTSYSVYGRSASGCNAANPAVAVVSVLQPPVITVNSGTICSGDQFVMQPGGASSYTFSSGSASVSPTSSATYSVYGSNGSCAATVPAIASVQVLARPTVSVNSGTICQGQSFTIQPSGAATYTVQNAGFVLSPSQSTVYFVTGTAANGCLSSNTAPSIINVNNGFSIGVNSGSICKGQSFTLSPWGASSYTYSSGSPVVSPNSTAVYTVSASNGGMCVAYATATVTVNNNPQITVNSGQICAGSVFTMTPSGAETYTFSNGSAYARPTANASYTVHGTSSKGCKSHSGAVANVAVYNNPVVTVAASSTVNCEGNNVQLKASGANTYQWSDGQTGESVNVTATGIQSFTVTGITSDGCENKATVVLRTDNCTGIAAQGAVNTNISVYPNPFQSELNILTVQDATLRVLDIGGRELRKMELHEGINTLDFSGLTPGVYVMRVESAAGVQTAKVIRR